MAAASPVVGLRYRAAASLVVELQYRAAASLAVGPRYRAAASPVVGLRYRAAASLAVGLPYKAAASAVGPLCRAAAPILVLVRRRPVHATSVSASCRPASHHPRRTRCRKRLAEAAASMSTRGPRARSAARFPTPSSRPVRGRQ